MPRTLSARFLLRVLGTLALIAPVAVTSLPAAAAGNTITVTGGTSDKATAVEGEIVTITAGGTPYESFRSWYLTSGGIALSEPTAKTTTFTMGSSPVAIKAIYEEALTSVTATFDTLTPELGQSVFIEGVVTGAEAASAEIEVLYEHESGLWRAVALSTTRADADGAFSIELSHRRDLAMATKYRVKATSPHGLFLNYRGQSTGDTVVREAHIAVASAGTKPAGEGTNAWGSVHGVEPYGPVWTEALIDGRWARSQTTTTYNAHGPTEGAFVIPLTYGSTTPGTHTFRVGAESPNGNVYSSPFTLERTHNVVAHSAGVKRVGESTSTWGTVYTAPNAPVWTEALVNGVWSRSQTATTDVSGRFTIPLTYGTNSAAIHTFRVVADTPGGTIHSKPFTVKRTAYVTAFNAGTARVGATTNTWGTIHGAANVPVWTEVMVGSQWRHEVPPGP